MEATTFTVLAERTGRWWTIRVAQIDGLAFQVRGLEQAEMMARKHIADAVGVPPESVRIEVRTEASVLPAVAHALGVRHAARQAAEAAATATHAAIGALLAEGSSFPEAAVLLGLSPDEIARFAPPSDGAADAGHAPGAPRRADPVNQAGPAVPPGAGPVNLAGAAGTFGPMMADR